MTRDVYEGKESIKYHLIRVNDASNYNVENKSLLRRLKVYSETSANN
ncbi:MAG: hypothetical protein P4M11_14935 [Candidatus Pacebacteria bacterium]|nr:hypothetical protein [Candidatus Paceibacterota bacterium]